MEEGGWGVAGVGLQQEFLGSWLVRADRFLVTAAFPAAAQQCGWLIG